MTWTEIFGLFFLIALFVLMLFFSSRIRRGAAVNLRVLPAYARLHQAISQSVEGGERLHLSIGRGTLVGPQSAAGFAGLELLVRLSRAAILADRPPIATSGDGALAVISQDLLNEQADRRQVEFDPIDARLTGITPFSYAAGTLVAAREETMAATILLGHFGSEAALIAEAGERAGHVTVGGTDDLSGQAVLYAGLHDPVIGEEAFAAAAYIGSGSAQIGSLLAQDVLRWVMILGIVIGAMLKLIGVW
ncbi:MAG TPA: DUF6754 domain-containing protein [Anaerolineales bacterium]|nr:DUF6754 domain-containing protein [Anaerolineales bacterium]